MTREEVNALTARMGDYCQSQCPSKVRFALIVVDMPTGRSSMVTSLPETRRVVELAEMIEHEGGTTYRDSQS
jgi:hypothetical protein